jgi:23S rRNA pseudouridine955/2504/2580 synthase
MAYRQGKAPTRKAPTKAQALPQRTARPKRAGDKSARPSQPARRVNAPPPAGNTWAPVATQAPVAASPRLTLNPVGVTQVSVGPDGDGQRLDQWLVKRFKDIPKSKLYRIIRTGEVRINKGRARPETRLKLADQLRLPPLRLVPEGEPISKRVPDRLQALVSSAVVYEDEDVLVIAKPSGLAVHGGSGLDFGVIEALRAARPRETLELAHRLDRDTSGLLLIARNRKALVALHALLREGRVEKRYLALVKGPWNLGDKLIDAPLETEARVQGIRKVRVGTHGKAAQSHFKPVDFFGAFATLMEVTIDTGRTHQIRVHAAHVGHPVALDERYGDADFNEWLKSKGLTRLFLHAQSLSFEWPNGKSFAASQPLPTELKHALDTLAQLRSQRRAERGPHRLARGRKS